MSYLDRHDCPHAQRPCPDLNRVNWISVALGARRGISDGGVLPSLGQEAVVEERYAVGVVPGEGRGKEG